MPNSVSPMKCPTGNSSSDSPSRIAGGPADLQGDAQFHLFRGEAALVIARLKADARDDGRASRREPRLGTDGDANRHRSGVDREPFPADGRKGPLGKPRLARGQSL